MLRFLTAGESHGPQLVGILEGMPAGLSLTSADVDADLARRQQGYGRGGKRRGRGWKNPTARMNESTG